MSTVPISALQSALIRRYDNLKIKDNFLIPTNICALKTLTKSVSTKTPTAMNLASAALLTPQPTIGFYPIEPLTGNDPLNYSCFQFGQGNLGWHFMYGHLGDIAFTCILFRVEIATPHILKNMFINPSDGCIYTIAAGYGTRNGNWMTLPRTAVQGEYKCKDKSFSFEAILSSECPWLQKCSFSQDNGITSVNISWKTGDELQHIIASLTPSKKPIYEGPCGCNPICIGGAGFLYWSYTAMTVSANIGTTQTLFTGTGWYDHQWMGVSLQDKYWQLINNIQTAFSTPKVTRWIWLTLQLPEDLQYMLAAAVGDGLIKKGDMYDLKITKSQGSNTEYNLTGKAKVLDTILYEDTEFPIKYSITVEDKTYILKAAFGNSGIYLPTGNLNWEGPGDVYNPDESAIIGIGFLEANNIHTETDLLKVQLNLAGIDQDKMKIFKLKKTPLKTGVLSVVIFLIILGLILTGIGLIIVSFKRLLL